MLGVQIKFAIALCLLVFAGSAAMAAFGGLPPLGPADALRHDFRPYDLFKLNYLGVNYCENLLDMRVNTPAYTHLGFDSNSSDAWHLHFPDDAGRLMEGVAWEDQFSPVVRLELMRRMVKGMLAAHIPGTRAYTFFRHRGGGKTFLISDDSAGAKQGRLTLVNWGDSAEGLVSVGFRAEKGGQWYGIEQFERTDTPAGAADLGTARSPRYWNESPYAFTRQFTNPALNVSFTGRYWLSDEDMPIEYGFESRDADNLQIVIGEPGKPMPILGNKDLPGVLQLPGGTAFASDRTGDKVFSDPQFNYLIIRKPTAFGSPGYWTALLVMWQERPDKIEALAANGYGEIRLSYGKKPGKVWLYPFQWINPKDMDYIDLNARSFLARGKLAHNGYPSQQMVNAGAAGLAAGAYLLSKYNDPLAVTARINAENAVDEIFDAEADGMTLTRAFFPVRAAAWMVKAGKAAGDQRIIDKYSPIVDRSMHRLLSELGYDGKGWASGWDHFNCIKAAWLAYDATGKQEYLDVYDRALTVYTIDAKGIYRYGVPMAAPGGFETYSGALALGAWGNAGKMDWVNLLINLDVPNGWNNPTVPLADIWNDAGSGPWAQDDANPEYVGFCLRGANIPQKRKYVLPVGSFPVYGASGKVEVTRQPMVENPFFPRGADKLEILPEGKTPTPPKVSTIVIKPGGSEEKSHLVREVGKVESGQRMLSPDGLPLTYRFETKGVSGAAVDLTIKGRYRIDVSPDGKRWYARLESWSDKPCEQSLDLSTFTGSHDELLRLFEIVPADDGKYLQPDGSFVYRLDLPDVTECFIELLVGNDYRVQCSSDGKTWHDELTAGQIKSKPAADAAWLRMLDVTKYLSNDRGVYIKLSDAGDSKSYDGKHAFLRRLAVYGVLNSGSVLVRIANTSNAGEGLVVQQAVFRSW